MKLKCLKVINFRNYETATFLPGEGLNLLVGPNGSGKTNLIEALYFLALTKSFRTSEDINLIQNGKANLRIEGEFSDQNLNQNYYQLILTKEGKKVFNNTNQIRLLSDYIAKIQLVLYNPDDVRIIKDAPHIRRRYLNLEISKYDKNYLFHLNDYNKVLKQRNSYLKQINLHKTNQLEYLEILTIKLIELGLDIAADRANFIKKLNAELALNYQKLEEEGNLILKYYSKFQTKSKESLLKKAQSEYLKEIEVGKTLFGIQLDDFEIFLNQTKIREYGSEGQQKKALIALKLAELAVFKEKNSDWPILILDDLFSKLDTERINQILKVIPSEPQVFITMTDPNQIKIKLAKKPQIFKIKHGIIEQE